MADCVVDASAILALVKGEPGAGIVRARISRSVVSTVNVAEVGTKLVDWGMTGAGLRHVILNLGFEVRPFDFDQALAAAALRTATRSHGLSLGDRACLALAQSTGLPVLTADRAWRGVGLEVAIEVIRT
jgi:PIN domain nuclease of toxin-antitoxin system